LIRGDGVNVRGISSIVLTGATPGVPPPRMASGMASGIESVAVAGNGTDSPVAS